MDEPQPEGDANTALDDMGGEAMILAALQAIDALEGRANEQELKKKLDFYKNLGEGGLLVSFITLVVASVLVYRLNNSDEADLCQVDEIRVAMLWYIPIAAYMVLLGALIKFKLHQIKYDHMKLADGGLYGENSLFNKLEELLGFVVIAKFAFWIFALVTFANEKSDCFDQKATKEEFQPLYVVILALGCLDMWIIALMCGCLLTCFPCGYLAYRSMRTRAIE